MLPFFNAIIVICYLYKGDTSKRSVLSQKFDRPIIISFKQLGLLSPTVFTLLPIILPCLTFEPPAIDCPTLILAVAFMKIRQIILFLVLTVVLIVLSYILLGFMDQHINIIILLFMIVALLVDLVAMITIFFKFMKSEPGNQ